MTKEHISITIDDLSMFAKSLRNKLKQRETLPGHATMLGLVAKAAGYDNYQHLKALAPPRVTQKPNKQMVRASRIWKDGVMTRWPKQTAVQGLCLWVFWADMPARVDMTEKDVNAILNARHSFADHALLRRSLVEHRLVQRTIDGRVYRRIEQAPPADVAHLIAAQRPSNTALRFSRKATTPS
jgi:hypothetical protein